MKQLTIFGAGGHAREVAQLVEDINLAQPDTWRLVGFLADPNTTVVVSKPLPAPFLGGVEWLLANPEASVIVAAGDPVGRRALVQRLTSFHPSLTFATLVHPRAWLAKQVTIGAGSVVYPGVLINADVHVGNHAILNLGCTISHDCQIGNFASLSPGVHLAGAVILGEAVDVGTGASVRPNTRVGEGSIVGAGAVVVADLPDHCIAYGVPAVVHGTTGRK